MYIEASRRRKGDNAKLEINLASLPALRGKTCMSFLYSMRGKHNHMGTLRVLINGEQAFVKNGDQGNDWQEAQITYNKRISSVRITSGAHHSERTAPILSPCHGVFTDRSIFRYAWEYYFQRKFKFKFT